MNNPGTRVLAALASVAVGGVFVAASALGALADSPSPATLKASVSGQVVTLSGSLQWNGLSKCTPTKAAYGIVWNDSGDPGLPAPGNASLLVGLTGAGGTETDNNRVHIVDPGCTFTITHTYVADLPAKACVIAYDYRAGQTSPAFHSIWEADGPGGPGNTDNSILKPDKSGIKFVCTDLVKRLSDVAISQTGSPSSVAPGDTITYTIGVGNTGSKSATATTQFQKLVVTLDPNTTFVSKSNGGWSSCSVSGQVVTCFYNHLLATSAVVAPPLQITVRALDNGESSVIATAHVDNGDNSDDADLTNQDASVSTPVNTPPQDIRIVKTATPQVQVGDPITYTMTVTNTSSVATTGTITVTDPLPSKVAFQSVSATSWNCSGGQNLSCTWLGGSLAPGHSTTSITVIATAKQSAVPSVTNTAFAHMNNITVQGSATTTVDTPVNLTLSKSADPASGSDVSLGQDIVYTLHYANTGTTNANNVVITDAIPAGTTYKPGSASCTTACTVSFSGNVLHFALTIGAGRAGNATFTVTVDSSDVNGQLIDNQAQITFNGSTTPSNITHHRVFVPSGDLALVKSVSYTKPATVGSVLTYTLKATASGNITQHNVAITDAIPDGTTYVTGSGTCSNGCSVTLVSGSLVWTVGDMAPGDVVTTTFRVTVNGPVNGTVPTQIVNVGAIASDETPSEPSNRVVVPLTAVLGTKIIRNLPFTGFDALQNALLGAVLVGGGLVLLTSPRVQAQRRAR